MSKDKDLGLKAIYPASKEELREALLRLALLRLANEASGFKSMADPFTHEHTNIAVLGLRIDEARALLAKQMPDEQANDVPLGQCSSCRTVGAEARCDACPRTPWQEYATSAEGLREYDKAETAQLRVKITALAAQLKEAAEYSLKCDETRWSVEKKFVALEAERDALRAQYQLVLKDGSKRAEENRSLQARIVELEASQLDVCQRWLNDASEKSEIIAALRADLKSAQEARDALRRAMRLLEPLTRSVVGCAANGIFIKEIVDAALGLPANHPESQGEEAQEKK